LEILMTMAPIFDEGVPSLSFLWQPAQKNTELSPKLIHFGH
jgi:hypothetical protein